jgi:hypothetical protein
MNQTEKVLELLRKAQDRRGIRRYIQGNGITQKDSIREFGCYRLAARIKELRDHGAEITTDRFAFGHLATYTLIDTEGMIKL